ncbi:MAG: ImmA/IrrE family metallo-endopeptidase [Polynucleobacter sp.]
MLDDYSKNPLVPGSSPGGPTSKANPHQQWWGFCLSMFQSHKMKQMERISSINPKRLLWCCAENSMTLDQLSRETGVTLKALEGLVSGSTGLTFNQLSKVADYFGRGVLFFLEEDEVLEGRIHTPEFRTIANQKPEISLYLKKLIERTEKQRDIYLGLVEDYDNEEVPLFSPPNLNDKDLKVAANEVRKWLGLGQEDSFEKYRNKLEGKGIIVFRSNGYKGSWQIPKESKILGFNLYDKKHPLIFIRKHFSEAHQNFTLMHELGHILLHKNSSIDDESDFSSTSGIESEANKFAGLVLVPDAYLNLINDDEKPKDVSLYQKWLKEYSVKWCVSTEVILRRLLDEGRLSKAAYLEYRQWVEGQGTRNDAGGVRLYRHREPKHMFGDAYVRTVIQSLPDEPRVAK